MVESHGDRRDVRAGEKGGLFFPDVADFAGGRIEDGRRIEVPRRSGRPCGQETLSSKASTPASWQRSLISTQASLWNSSVTEAMSAPGGWASLRRLNPSIQS